MFSVVWNKQIGNSGSLRTQNCLKKTYPRMLLMLGSVLAAVSVNNEIAITKIKVIV
jgi:hypothetical protein